MADDRADEGLRVAYMQAHAEYEGMRGRVAPSLTNEPLRISTAEDLAELHRRGQVLDEARRAWRATL